MLVSAADLDPSYGFTVLYYPVFSPDSQWVVFNASAGDTYDDVDATLFAIPVDGGEVIELGHANQGVGLSNSQPKWAPATVEDPVYWIAFSSRRDYGSITSGNPQIWMTSFDPEMAAIGEDPNTGDLAINQATDQNNHVPVWVDCGPWRQPSQAAWMGVWPRERSLPEPSWRPIPEAVTGSLRTTADNHQHRTVCSGHELMTVNHTDSPTAWLNQDAMVVEERAARGHGSRVTDDNVVDGVMIGEGEDFVTDPLGPECDCERCDGGQGHRMPSLFRRGE